MFLKKFLAPIRCDNKKIEGASKFKYLHKKHTQKGGLSMSSLQQGTFSFKRSYSYNFDGGNLLSDNKDGRTYTTASIIE